MCEPNLVQISQSARELSRIFQGFLPLQQTANALTLRIVYIGYYDILGWLPRPQYLSYRLVWYIVWISEVCSFLLYYDIYTLLFVEWRNNASWRRTWRPNMGEIGHFSSRNIVLFYSISFYSHVFSCPGPWKSNLEIAGLPKLMLLTPSRITGPLCGDYMAGRDIGNVDRSVHIRWYVDVMATMLV